MTSRPAPPCFSLDRYDLHGVTVIRCIGEIDLSAAEPLHDLISEGLLAGPVVIDASLVTFLDCSGLAPILRGYTAADVLRRPFFLAAPSTAVLRLLDRVSLLERLEISPCAPSAARGAFKAPLTIDLVPADGRADSPTTSPTA